MSVTACAVSHDSDYSLVVTIAGDVWALPFLAPYCSCHHDWDQFLGWNIQPSCHGIPGVLESVGPMPGPTSLGAIDITGQLQAWTWLPVSEYASAIPWSCEKVLPGQICPEFPVETNVGWWGRWLAVIRPVAENRSIILWRKVHPWRMDNFASIVQ